MTKFTDHCSDILCGPIIKRRSYHQDPTFSVKLSPPPVDSFIMFSKRNMDILELMWTLRHKLVPISEMHKANICLTKGTSLHIPDTHSCNIGKEIFEDITDICEMYLTFGLGLNGCNGELFMAARPTR
jgi:hypothetical protein